MSFFNLEFLNSKSRKKGMICNSIEITSAEEWIRIVPVGNFPEHPDGAHEITQAHIVQMATNFANSKKDVLFDYEHRSLWGDTKAAGWSPEVEARDDGLYLKYPEFTPEAAEMIKNREYRYFSPVYLLNTKSRLGMNIGASLISVALTNMPYMENEIDHIRNSKNEREDMNLSAEALEKLGLTETATQDEIDAAILAFHPQSTEAPPTDPPASDDDETSKANAALEARLAALEAAQTAVQTAQVDALVNSAIAQGKITPAQKAIWLNSAKSDFEGTKAILDGIKVNAAVPGKVKIDRSAGGGDDKVNFGDYIRNEMIRKGIDPIKS